MLSKIKKDFIENDFYKLWLSCKELKRKKEDVIIPLLAFVIFFVLESLSVYFNYFNITNIARQIESRPDQLLDWSINLIGFVIAGYAIIASFPREKMMSSLQKKNDTENNMTYFKSYHLNFFKIIIEMVLIMFIVAVLSVDAISSISKSLDSFLLESEFKFPIFSLFLVCFANSLFIYLIMLIKSFIQNLYEIVTVFQSNDDVKDEE